MAQREAARYRSLGGAYAAYQKAEDAEGEKAYKPTTKYLEGSGSGHDPDNAREARRKQLEAAAQALTGMQRHANKSRLLSQNLIAIFSYCDQQECMKLQALNRAAYNEYIPKIMKQFVIERPFVHLFLAHKKRFMIAYLDNYKAVELPRPPGIVGGKKKKKGGRSSSNSSSSSSDSSSSSSDSEFDEYDQVVEKTERIGFEIPDRLKHYTSV